VLDRLRSRAQGRGAEDPIPGLAPDVIFLDEVQRIKDGRTETAQAAKRPESGWATPPPSSP